MHMSDDTAAADLKQAARKWARAEELRAETANHVRAAASAGASESEIARTVGINRLTVRRWLGK